jgi:hypothetical protein
VESVPPPVTGSNRRPQAWFRLLAAAIILLSGIGGGLALAPLALAGPATLYVSSSGTNSGSCTDEATPCANIQYAVQQAASGDTIDVSGTLLGGSKIGIPVTIAQEPGGSPAILDGNGAKVAFIEPTADVTYDQITVEDGGANSGGAVTVLPGGTLSIIDSTFADNTASASGPSGGIGGAIYDDQGTLTITNSTFADNTAQTAGVGGTGGAIATFDPTMTITDSTFADNSSQSGPGNAIDFDGGTSTLAGNILADPASAGAPIGGECAGSTPTDDGYDIDDDGSCGFSGPGSISDSTTIDGHLGPLEANGGPTPTVALLKGPSGGPSDPALGAIPGGYMAHGQASEVCSQDDQRGVARSAPCDIGSFAASIPRTTLYALPDGTASAPCTSESLTDSSVCSFETALSEANGDSDRYVIDLEGPTGDNLYTGLGGLGVADTISASMTIQADPDAGYDNDSPTLDGESSGAVLDIAGTYDVTVKGVTLEDGQAPAASFGGGVSNGGYGTLDVTGSTFTDNSGNGGGAISNSDGGALIVSDSSFVGNQSDGGGAIDNGTDETGSGTLSVSDSTFLGNQANTFSGGAILNGYGLGDTGAVTVDDSTFFKNSAPSDDGGAIDNGDDDGTGTLTVQSSTFVGGTVIENGNNGGTGSVTVEADEFTGVCGQASGTWTDDGYNVGINPSCFNGGTADNDSAGKGLVFLFGSLADNGGPTNTVTLLAGNPGIGILPDPTVGLCPSSGDQRGVATPAGVACDAGAVQNDLSQTIGSLSSVPTGAAVGGPTYSPRASALSDLPVTITVDPSASSVCSITNGVVSFLAAGTCLLDFNQPGNVTWLPATQVQQSFAVLPAPLSTSVPSTPSTSTDTGGYQLVGADGGVFAFGHDSFLGSFGGQSIHSPIVGMVRTSDDHGYWLVAADGGVFTFGDAGFYGSLGGTHLHAFVIGMARTADNHGYWLVSTDGGVFAFGDANYYGSATSLRLTAPVVGIQRTDDGQGYWLVTTDGGVFAFGDAGFYGSAAGYPLHALVVGMARTADDDGYWLVAADGGVFSFGDAHFYGSAGGFPLDARVVGIKRSSDGLGYWLASADGGVFAFGDADFYGSMGGRQLRAPVVGIT